MQQPKIPRVVNLERLKHLYASFSIPELLAENGIAGHQLVSPAVDPKTHFNLKTAGRGNFTPLWFYDNTEFDSRSADEWVKRPHGVPVPVPALAYMPARDGHRHEWTRVDVVDYDAAAKMFTVTDRSGTRAGTLPRLQVHFVGEDPRDFVKRIKYAFLRRDYCEKIMLWYMYMDKINIDDVPDQLSDATTNKIWTLIFSTKKLFLEFLLKKKSIIDDLQKNYKRWHYAVMLQFKISKCPEKFDYIDLPNFEFGYFTKKLKLITTGMCNFEDMKSEYVRKRTVYVIPEIFYALSYINAENMLLKEKQFLITIFVHPVTLDEFLKIQLENITQTSNWLHNYWIKEVTYKCRNALKNVKNGWFDIFSSNLKVYESPINKLRKLMALIQFMMEEYLRFLVVNTIQNYANLIEQPCTLTIGINANFIWGKNLYNSPFKGNTGPFFAIQLAMNENGPFLSPGADEFEPAVVSLLTRSVSLSHDIPVIHPMLLTEMKFPNEEKLVSIGLLDEKIAGKQTIIENSIRSAVVPLKAYCREYVVHLPLFNTDVKSYVQAFFDGNPSLFQVREEISMQLKQKTKLEKSLPETMTIGLFAVNTKSLRSVLIEKRRELATLLMKQHASVISDQLELACEEYKRIHLRLGENSVSIEQVFETREWIETLPTVLQNQTEIVKRLIMEMDMLDTFYWIIEYEQLKLKLDAKIWPYKIENKIKESLENLALEIEKFEKIQFEDESALQDKIEYITSIILKLTIENSLTKVFEIAVEVSKTWKLIKEIQLFSQILNHRQRLFGHQVIAYDNVQQLVKEFEPYKDLWQSAAEFFKMQSAWMQNPISNLDRNSLEHSLEEFLNIMNKCIDQFVEVPGTLSVAKEMKTQIEEYRPIMELMKDILNPGMRQRHWDLLAHETGVHIILSQSLNLKKCLEMGVGNQADKLKLISENASKEYLIELALNKIIKYWENVKLQIIPFEDTGTFIMKMSDEEIQMLDDHIALTQQLSQSSFKGIFEEELSQWEGSLSSVKTVIEAWDQLQNQWMYLKRMFSDPDIKNKLFEESIKFERVDRTWRRIMKITSNKPWVMTVCPDKQLLSTLNYANKQLNLIEKKVSNHLETRKSEFTRWCRVDLNCLKFKLF